MLFPEEEVKEKEEEEGTVEGYIELPNNLVTGMDEMELMEVKDTDTISKFNMWLLKIECGGYVLFKYDVATASITFLNGIFFAVWIVR